MNAASQRRPCCGHRSPGLLATYGEQEYQRGAAQDDEELVALEAELEPFRIATFVHCGLWASCIAQLCPAGPLKMLKVVAAWTPDSGSTLAIGGTRRPGTSSGS